MFSNVSLVVPLAGGDPARTAGWEWLRRRYAAYFPTWEIVEARADEVPWRKGVALLRGTTRAAGDILVVADADVWIETVVLLEAVELVRGGASWVVPHRQVHRLDEASTRVLLAEDPITAQPRGTLIRAPYQGYAGGGLFVVERGRWSASGGVPIEFEGWGAEDETLALVLDTICGPHVRLGYDLWHLWHEAASHVTRSESNALLRLYRSAAGNTEKMQKLIRQGGAALADDLLPAYDETVTMVALVDFPYGPITVRAGTVFTATRDEARRFAVRRDRVAVPLAEHGAVPVVALVDQPHGDTLVKAGETFTLSTAELEREAKRSAPLVALAPPNEPQPLRQIARRLRGERQTSFEEKRLAAAHLRRQRG